MLTSQPDPCHYLAHPDGSWWEPAGDGTPHYDSADKATKRIGSEADGVPAGLIVEQFAGPCWTITCDGEDGSCDNVPDDDVWGTIHFPDEDTARSMADLYDFTVDPDGRAWCPDCQAVRGISLAEAEERLAELDDEQAVRDLADQARRKLDQFGAGGLR